MKYSDINKRYTDIVTEYMSKGYTINTASMSGSQGEHAKIDLTDGKEIIRIVVDSFSNWRADTEGIEIIVGRSTDDVKPNESDRFGTIWNNNLEVLHSERFYKIGGYRSNYYSTEEDARNASNIRFERYKARQIATETYEANDKAMEIAKRIVRNKMGVKRVSDQYVHIFRDERGYLVCYKDKKYRLH